MKILSSSFFFLIGFLLVFEAHSQNCFSTGVNGMVINMPCSLSCVPMKFKVPHLKSTSEYQLVSIPYNPFPYTSPAGTELTTLYQDDQYGPAIPMPFPFCFYDSLYTAAVVGSNGLVTFDVSNANCANAYTVTPPIPSAGTGAQCQQGGVYYPRAAIMGAYTDLDPRSSYSPPDRKIEWRFDGVAPCRKLIVSYYNIGMFGCGTYSPTGTNCNSQFPSTFQIVMYESTGLIDVFIQNKDCFSTTGSGNGIIGIQDWNRTKATAVPGKNATNWTEFVAGYRFVPNGAASRFVKAEIQDITGTVLATTGITPGADTATTTPGLLDLNFPDMCPINNSTQYIIKTYFASCSNPALWMTSNDTVTVNKTGLVILGTTTNNPTSCNGTSDGSITVTPTNGVAPHTYSINGGSFQASNTFTGLAAGAYTILIKDASGCTSNAIPVTVVAGPPLSATVNVTPASCTGTSTGSASVTLANTGSFEFSLDGITYQASNTFSGLAAGNYTAYVRNAGGCSGTQTFVITEPSALEITATASPALCNGQNNGVVTLSGNGGVAPYQYSTGTGSYQASNTFNLGAGTYLMNIKDANGCIQSQQVTVTEPTAITSTSVTTDASCNGGADGTITVSASGGTGTYQYSSGGPFQSSNVFNVVPGTYYITTKDGNNCTYSETVTVGLTNNLTITSAGDQLICEGNSVNLNPVTNGNQFSWSPSTGLSSTSIQNPVASPVVTTQYIFTATLGQCSANDTILVNVNPAPVPNAGPAGDICYGQNYTLQGSGGVQYSWSGPNISDPNISNPVVTPSQTSDFLLHVTDANGCTSLQPAVVTVNVTPPIVVTATPDTVAANGDQFQLFASSVGTDYTWTPGSGLNDPNIPNPIVTVSGDITYTVTASTSAGCKGTATVRISMFEGPELYVPNAFTPNGDGNNDRFRPFPVGIKKLNYFRVFNRWGQMVYSTSSLYQGWDGKVGGVMQPTGVYIWVAEGVTKDDKTISKKGTVTLIR